MHTNKTFILVILLVIIIIKTFIINIILSVIIIITVIIITECCTCFSIITKIKYHSLLLIDLYQHNNIIFSYQAKVDLERLKHLRLS